MGTTNPYSNLDEEYLEQARALRPLRKQQKNLETFKKTTKEP